jgi:hypothetical protein
VSTAASFHFVDLAPGERREQHVRNHDDRPVRYGRLVVRVRVDPPAVSYYMRLHRAGGSRRRGQLASQHWAADCLRHWRTRWSAQADLADLRVRGVSQLLTSDGVPLDFFLESVAPLSLHIDVSRSGEDVTLALRNRDVRVVHVSAVLLGHVVGPRPRLAPLSSSLWMEQGNAIIAGSARWSWLYRRDVYQPRSVLGCDHGVTFDASAASGLASEEVRRRWPRLDGACPLGCGYRGIAYASHAHQTAGDW